MKIIDEEYVFNTPPRFNVLPQEGDDELANSTTPSVENLKVWKGSGNVVTVTDFLNGADNQTISVLGDGTTTISHNANIKTNTGANKLLAADKVYRFTFIDDVWYEDA